MQLTRCALGRARALFCAALSFPAGPASSSHPNGFDPMTSLPPRVAPEPSSHRSRRVAVFPAVSPAFLTAIANLFAGEDPAIRIQVSSRRIPDGHDVAGWAASGSLAGVIRIIGPVAHREALAWMRRADLLCLFAQGQREQIPAKVFEYLAAGAPILAITGEGATGDLVTRAGGAVVPDESGAVETNLSLLKNSDGNRCRLDRRDPVRDRPYGRATSRGRWPPR